MKWKQLIYWRISRNQSFTSARTVMRRHLPLRVRVTLCVCVCACVWDTSQSRILGSVVENSDTATGHLNLVWAAVTHPARMKTFTRKSSSHCFSTVFLSIFLCQTKCFSFFPLHSFHDFTLRWDPYAWTICLVRKRQIKSPSSNRRLCDIHSIKFPVVVKYIFAGGVRDGERTDHTSPCWGCFFLFGFFCNEVIWQSWFRTWVSTLHMKVHKLTHYDFLSPIQFLSLLVLHWELPVQTVLGCRGRFFYTLVETTV